MAKVTVGTRFITNDGKVYTTTAMKVIKHITGTNLNVYVVDDGGDNNQVVIIETQKGLFHWLYDEATTFTILEANKAETATDDKGFNIFGLFKGTRVIDNNGVIFTVTEEDCINAIITDPISGEKLTILHHEQDLFYSLSNTDQIFKVFTIDPSKQYYHSFDGQLIYFPLNKSGDNVFEDADRWEWTPNGIIVRPDAKGIHDELIGIDNEYVRKHIAVNNYFFNNEIELAQQLYGFYKEQTPHLNNFNYEFNSEDVFSWHNLTDNIRLRWKNVARKHLNSK